MPSATSTFSCYRQNQDRLTALEIDDGDGCVAPSVEIVQSGSNKSLSLLFRLREDGVVRPGEVAALVGNALLNGLEIAGASRHAPLTDSQLTKAESDFVAAVSDAGF